MRTIKNSSNPCTNCGDKSTTIWLVEKDGEYTCPICHTDYTKMYLEGQHVNSAN